MDDFQFMEIFKRKRIKFTLKSGTFLGIVQRINANKTVILEDVVNFENGRKFPGVKLFFGHEILNVEFPHVSKAHVGPNSCDHGLSGQLSVSEFQPYTKGIVLDADDDDDSHVNFVVIDEFHEKFGPALMHIQRQQVIGIGADGIGTFQHERLCWLQIATKNKVYLFDILLLGARAFKNGLSMILQNNRILKVTHDCRGIAGCLMAQFGVNLCNVFDTQVADILCFYTETGGFLPDRVSTLQEVVSLHLKVPSSRLSSLKIKSQLTKEDKEVWYVRPCPTSLLKVMALSVIHLQPLRLVLLDALMAEYTALVDSCLNSSREEPVHMQIIGSTNVLELPRELQNIVHMRRERQEWAINRYPVTEQGWLKRSNSRPVTASQNVQGQDTVTQSQPESAVPTATETVDPLPRLQASAEPLYHSNTPWVSELDATLSAQTPEAQQSSSKQPSEVLSPVLTSGSGAPALVDIVMAAKGRSKMKDPGQPTLPGPGQPIRSFGRGLLLQMSASQVQKERQVPGGKVEVLVPPGQIPSPVQQVVPQQAAPQQALLSPACGGRGRSIQRPQSLTSPLSMSFSSFRKT